MASSDDELVRLRQDVGGVRGSSGEATRVPWTTCELVKLRQDVGGVRGSWERRPGCHRLFSLIKHRSLVPLA